MKKPGRENKIAVVVGTITDDIRILEIPKMKVRHSLTYFIPKQSAEIFKFLKWYTMVMNCKCSFKLYLCINEYTMAGCQVY